MSAPAFTRGPWSFGKSGNGVQRIDSMSGAWESLAKVYVRTDGKPNPEGEANARLIAAAPDLYAALRDLVAAVESWPIDPVWTKEACAALAKVQP